MDYLTYSISTWAFNEIVGSLWLFWRHHEGIYCCIHVILIQMLPFPTAPSRDGSKRPLPLDFHLNYYIPPHDLETQKQVRTHLSRTQPLSFPVFSFLTVRFFSVLSLFSFFFSAPCISYVFYRTCFWCRILLYPLLELRWHNKYHRKVFTWQKNAHQIKLIFLN